MDKLTLQLLSVKSESLATLEALRAGQLAGVQRLDLSCGLSEFPRDIFNLADSLEILNLSGNALTSLPDDLPRLHKLRVIFCSDNHFTELPEVLGQCPGLTMVGFKANQIRSVPAAALPPNLRWLILTDNRISSLPPEIGQCAQLQKLMLAGNELAHLPPELAACTQLELLRLSANRFSRLPSCLLNMPRLAWLALAGNPMSDLCETAADNQQIKNIDWRQLTLGQPLGEGASGVIHQAGLQSIENTQSQVAVKLFKSAVTSDGLPRSEMAACMAVGSHPNLVGIVGKISQHSAGTQGLVMPLIDPGFGNLAAPPSLASCTRDMYADGATFTQPMVIRIALGVASAARHLHACGILHGDLYAHNILRNPEGDCLLGDFGAASFVPLEDKITAQALQRLEVRAFGILLGELLARCEPVESQNHSFESTLAALGILQQRCTQAVVSMRPVFDEIERQLTELIECVDANRHRQASTTSI